MTLLYVGCDQFSLRCKIARTTTAGHARYVANGVAHKSTHRSPRKPQGGQRKVDIGDAHRHWTDEGGKTRRLARSGCPAANFNALHREPANLGQGKGAGPQYAHAFLR